MLKKDSWWLGAIIGVFLPAVIFGLIYLVITIVGLDIGETKSTKYLEISNIMLLSIIINLFPFRYYMVNHKFDKTGRAILVATVIYIAVFFGFYL